MEQTKYFLEKNGEYKEIILNRDNWFYVQVNASIRFAFMKYKIKLPNDVIIKDCKHWIFITIIRPNLDSFNEIISWENNQLCVLDELNNQAEANSTTEEDTEDWIQYKFEII